MLLFVKVLYSLQVKLSYALSFLLYNAVALTNFTLINCQLLAIWLYLALTIAAVLKTFCSRKSILLIWNVEINYEAKLMANSPRYVV